MIVDLDTISENLNRIQHKLGEAKRTVLPQPKPLKSVDEEVDDELEKPYYKYQEEDSRSFWRLILFDSQAPLRSAIEYEEPF